MSMGLPDFYVDYHYILTYKIKQIADNLVYYKNGVSVSVDYPRLFYLYSELKTLKQMIRDDLIRVKKGETVERLERIEERLKEIYETIVYLRDLLHEIRNKNMSLEDREIILREYSRIAGDEETLMSSFYEIFGELLDILAEQGLLFRSKKLSFGALSHGVD